MMSYKIIVGLIMKLIKITDYLEKLINTDIKVITGVRCADKSKFLEEFKKYIIKIIM